MSGIHRDHANELKSKLKTEKMEAERYKPRMRYQLAIDTYQVEKLVEDYISKLFRTNKDNKEEIKKLGSFFE
jgi:hypothetical protein